MAGQTPQDRPGSVPKPTSASTSTSCTGAVNENTFLQSFEDVPTLQIASIKDLNNIMKNIHMSIQNCNENWNKRVDSLKKIRSLLLIGVVKYKEFFNNLIYFEQSLQISVKDLRSQVVKEACITIAFLSVRLGVKFDHFAESIFHSLIELIPNSAKVIASSGLVAIRFILEYTLAPRIIPILANSLESKSKDIRCACCEFFDQILRAWPTQVLKIHITILQDSIKKGIADADSNARLFSRNAFCGFCKHFPVQGEMLFNRLEPTYRKILLTNCGSKFCIPKSLIAEEKLLPSHHIITSRQNNSKRSNSAIDFQAAQRTKAHMDHAALARQKVNPSVSSQYVFKKTNEVMNQSETSERSRNRISISQPSSRSGSPSSKFTLGQHKLQRSNSKIPRSQNTRREASSDRLSTLGSDVIDRQPLILTKNRRPITQQLLTQNQEAKTTFTDAHFNITGLKSQRKLLNYYSDESKTSNTFFSECSIDSLSQTSLSFNGSQPRLSREIKNYIIDIEDIISNCEKSNWNDRKQGLLSLQSYLLQGNIINITLLKKLTDVLTKMFIDSETKSISLFLDTLNKLIITHSQYLEYWLYILLVKLFNKGGSNILHSMYLKVVETTEIIMKSFPCSVQLTAVFKFLTDPTLTPNVKMKIFAMSYISKLAITTDSSSTFPSVVDGKKDYTTLALMKIIGWTMYNNIKQDPELRLIAQEVILALYSLNASQIILRITQLPEEYQEVISRLLKIKVKKNSVDRSLSQRYYNQQLPASLASPPLQPDTAETLSKMYKLLKPTSTEVQKSSLDCHNINKKDVASYDIEFNHNLYNKISYTAVNEFKQILGYLLKDTLSNDCKESLLNHLKELIKDGPSNLLMKNFKNFVKVFLKLSEGTQPNIIRIQSITLIACLVQTPEMTTCFHNFTELILMKLFKMCCDSYIPVVKVAEKCLLTCCESLQPETIVRIIIPLMSAKEYSVNLITIKMMTKLIDKYGKPLVSNRLKEIMPSLLQGYDNSDSTIRKSAVFCMVSLQKVVGEQNFASLISGLSAGKLELLNLYIKRA